MHTYFSFSRNSKQRVVHEGSRPVTGLAFKMVGKNMILFMATDQSVFSVNVTAKDRGQKDTLDQHGCRINCSVLSDMTQDNQFVLGRQDVSVHIVYCINFAHIK